MRTTLAVILLSLMTVGCSSFNREWKSALETPVRPGSVEGCWGGSWISDVSGHNGRLRCIITPGEETREYRAFYKATYKRILTFAYAVPMQTVSTNGSYRLSGAHDLGALAGGVYSYEATIKGDHFTATYTSRWDYGEFRMERAEDQRQER